MQTLINYIIISISDYKISIPISFKSKQVYVAIWRADPIKPHWLQHSNECMYHE